MNAPNLLELKAYFEEELIQSLDRSLGNKEFKSKRLLESMRYALSSKGKRLRPLLVLSMALTSSKEKPFQTLKKAMPLALAVEYIHTYSLIHDDLPAMDDDDFRRGRLSLHRRFDEGLAILAGDALLADAFFIAASVKKNPLAIVKELALMAGSYGLVAGQAEDLAEGQKDSFTWLAINHAKTARLFEACAKTSALCVIDSPHTIEKASAFGRAFGVAFQIQDDLDDEQGLVKTDDRVIIKNLFAKNFEQAKNLAHEFDNNYCLLMLMKEAFKSL